MPLSGAAKQKSLSTRSKCRRPRETLTRAIELRIRQLRVCFSAGHRRGRRHIPVARAGVPRNVYRGDPKNSPKMKAGDCEETSTDTPCIRLDGELCWRT